MRDELGYTETMSLQGSFWMMPRERYLEYIPFREQFGSWGNEGIEIACWTWLSGRRVLCNHNTWYGHLFRTQGGAFSFPYPQSERAIRSTKAMIWDCILNKKFPNQIHHVRWLIEKFMPISVIKDGKEIGWTEEKLKEL